MSRSIHQTYKKVFKGKSKAEVDEMFSESDPEVEALAKKKAYKRIESQQRKGGKFRN